MEINAANEQLAKPRRMSLSERLAKYADNRREKKRARVATGAAALLRHEFEQDPTKHDYGVAIGYQPSGVEARTWVEKIHPRVTHELGITALVYDPYKTERACLVDDCIVTGEWRGDTQPNLTLKYSRQDPPQQ